MLTQCPVCKTVFRVRTEQLSVAKGKVRCSRCRTVFNATEQLYKPGKEHKTEEGHSRTATGEGRQATATSSPTQKPERKPNTPPNKAGKPTAEGVRPTPAAKKSDAATTRHKASPRTKIASHRAKTAQATPRMKPGTTPARPLQSATPKHAGERPAQAPTPGVKKGDMGGANSTAAAKGSPSIGKKSAQTVSPSGEKPSRTASSQPQRRQAAKPMATPSPSSAPSQKVTSAKTSHPTQRRGATEEPAGRAKKDLTPKAAATQKPTIRQPATSNHSGHTISTPIQQASEKLRGHGEPSAHEKKTATTPSRDDELFELFGHPDKERSAWESTSEGENWDLFSEQNIEAVMRPLQQQPAQQTSVSPTPEAPQQQEAAELMPPSRDVSTEQETAPEEKDERPSPQEPGHTAAAMPEQADSGVPTTSGDDAIMGELSEPAHKPAHDSYSLPPQLQQPGKSSVTTLLWGGGILLLLGCLVLQYIYYYRSSLSENDTLRPLLDAMCQVTECQLPPRRDLGKIELADHLMQYHPRYKNSLLITATLVNRADYVQPFPLVEVVMTDLEQKVIARRHFRPEQYLIGDAPGQQFLPNTEIPLMLEVVDPGESAVGFEFHFY